MVNSPGRRRRDGSTPPPLSARLAGLLLLTLAGCGTQAARLPPGDYTPREPPELELPEAQFDALRADALARARVWQPPGVPVAEADLAANPPGPGALDRQSRLACRFLFNTSTGYSPKFRCVLPGGDVLKVKYGWNSREVRTEVAATRLLGALGFGADRMYVVERVRCHGCPAYPHEKLSWFNAFFVDYSRYRDFDFVSIERPLAGRILESASREGWRWDELARIDPARGGSSRAEVDALRLVAVFLSNWDLKDANQRLTCLAEPAASTECARPLAFMQDLGTSFGPHAMDLKAWTARPVWADPATCLVSMKGLPFDGGTFVDARISEEGRLFLAERLGALSEGQVREMFAAARFHDFAWDDAEDGDLRRWVAAFRDRVRQIADRPPCPGP
jgi:hypothetical protein